MLIFCGAVDSAHRVSRLLQLMQTSSKDDVASKRNDLIIREFSSSLGQSARTEVLSQFKKPLAGSAGTCLVCSDVMTRGIDVSDCDVVINFDMPGRLPTYLHRVGRTARAGRSGVAITLLEKYERNNFKNMLKKCSGAWSKMQRYDYPSHVEAEYSPIFGYLTDILGKVLEADKRGSLDLQVDAADFE